MSRPDINTRQLKFSKITNCLVFLTATQRGDGDNCTKTLFPEIWVIRMVLHEQIPFIFDMMNWPVVVETEMPIMSVLVIKMKSFLCRNVMQGEAVHKAT